MLAMVLGLLMIPTGAFCQKQSPAYLNAPFDIGIKRIPVPFLGHDIEQVYNAFDQRKKAEVKGEFESTEQYQKRLSNQLVNPIFGSVGLTDVLAFVVNPSSQYDADSQTLTISLETSKVWYPTREIVERRVLTDKSRLGISIKSGETIDKKSVMQNKFGAKVEVSEHYMKSFDLAVHNQSNFETEKVLSEYEKENLREMPGIYKNIDQGKTVFVKRINIPPTNAKMAKDKVSTFVLVKLTTPYISDGTFLSQATFDAPSQIFHQFYYVDVDLLEIWIYDKPTGELITKITGK